MKFEGTKTSGWENAIIGCRLPMCKNYEEAKSKSDSTFYANGEPLQIGEKDLKLLKNLIKADGGEGKTGQPNSKYLQMIHVQVSITAPLYWWSEADTYRVGVVKNSTSKMHRLLSYPITEECFEENYLLLGTSIRDLEILRNRAIETKDKRDWKKLVVNIPESWLQTRMVDLNYATLRNICCWRKNHKLTEWSESFINWAKGLPYADELLF